MKNVTEAEFAAFLKAYPARLRSQLVTIADPPLVVYYDEHLQDGICRSPGPELVAKHVINREGTPHEFLVAE